MSLDYSTYAILIKSSQDHKVEMQHRVFLLKLGTALVQMTAIGGHFGLNFG